MPEVSRPIDGDQFHEMAHNIYRLFNKGTGTMHANVRLTRDVLNNLATANYKNGFKDGYGEGAIAARSAKAGPLDLHSSTPPSPVAQAVPEPEGIQDPNIAFEMRDIQGAPVITVTISGQVLLRGQPSTDPAQVVFALSQLGQQMGQYQRDQGAVAASGG
jgi:hypothetical protein